MKVDPECPSRGSFQILSMRSKQARSSLGHPVWYQTAAPRPRQQRPYFSCCTYNKLSFLAGWGVGVLFEVQGSSVYSMCGKENRFVSWRASFPWELKLPGRKRYHLALQIIKTVTIITHMALIKLLLVSNMVLETVSGFSAYWKGKNYNGSLFTDGKTEAQGG